MTTKQMAKKPDALLRHPGLITNPHLPMSEWRDFFSDLDSHKYVATKLPTIELKSDGKTNWYGFRWAHDKGNPVRDEISNPCPQTLKVVKVTANALCFDDLASALDDVDLAPKGLSFTNVVHANVLGFPAPAPQAQSANCTDVKWYPYATLVELRGDTDGSKQYAPKLVKTEPGKWCEYQTGSLWLKYLFIYGSVANPDVPNSTALLQIWLYTGDDGKNAGVGAADQWNPPNGWVQWEIPNLSTNLALASALRKHLWGAKGNHVVVRVDDLTKTHISRISFQS